MSTDAHDRNAAMRAAIRPFVVDEGPDLPPASHEEKVLDAIMAAIMPILDEGTTVEWGVQVAANRVVAYRGFDEAEAREKLAYYRAIWDEKAWQVKRRLTTWEDVPDA